MGPTQQVWDVQPAAGAVAALCRNIADAVSHANFAPTEPSMALDPFVAAGRGLYDLIFPKRQNPHIQSLRQALQQLNGPLMISTDDPDIFWELLYDDVGEGFFALKFDVARRLKRRGVPGGAPRHRTEWRCLMVADPNQDEKDWALPDTAQEAAKLRERLAAMSVRCDDYLEGRKATVAEVVSRLTAGEYDIIHYAGHIVPDPELREYALRLNGGELLHASAIRDLLRGTPIVFLNGCWSGQARGPASAVDAAGRRPVSRDVVWSGEANPLEGFMGLTDALLEGEAQIVVGSLFEVPDEGAREFAVAYYEAIIAGKSLGEAMRHARHHVMGDPRCAAAWACFVAYGDPCLRITIKDELDELGRLLSEGVGLCRSQLDGASQRVLEQALAYGRPTNSISSVHLLAALVDGGNTRLRERLERDGVPPQMLHDAFCDLFAAVTAQTGEVASGPPQCSSTVKRVLSAARDRAMTAGRQQVAEVDLVASFFAVEGAGGAAGKILRELGVDVVELAGEPGTRANPVEVSHTQSEASAPQVQPPLAAPKTLGPLNGADYTPTAWQTLVRAARWATIAGHSGLGSAAVLAGMLRADETPLCRGLSRIGVPVGRVRDALRLDGSEEAGRTVPEELALSQSVRELLLLAQTIAAGNRRDHTDEADLLAAFVGQGGGSAGRWLRGMGVSLESLLTELFTDTGDLDQARFDERGQRIVSAAVDCARRKGYDRVGRRHLLFGMLAQTDGHLATRLGEQGLDPSRLADLLYVGMDSRPGPSQARANARCMSGGLISVLCAAETGVRGPHEARVGERQLLQALLKDGGGNVGEFMVRNGVRWTTLL